MSDRTASAAADDVAAPSCSCCGSGRWIHGAEVHGLLGGDLLVRVAHEPGSLLGPHTVSPLVAELCGDCGHLELKAVHPRDLYRMFESRAQ